MRVVRLRMLLGLAFAVLVLRLIHLQIIQGATYRRLAEQNRLRVIDEPAPRGLILDRRGRILASNHTIFRVAIVPQELEDLSAVLGRVGGLLHLTPESLEQTLSKERSLAFVPATIVSRVPKDMALRLEEERWQLPGLLVKAETIRHYPNGSSAAHVLGYLNQPTADELPLLKQYGIRPKHLIGRRGIERVLDQALRGHAGGVLVEVNHRARQVRIAGHREPETGARVVLTIDAQLQSLIEQAFGTQPGACVVLDPKTGEILALVSNPMFSPEAFTLGDAKAVRGFLDSPDSPMMNRAAEGTYAPGSIAKLVTAAAALESKVITPATTFTCPGSIRIGDRVFHCWNHDGHGPLNLSEALMQSCNVYFMQVALKLGAARLRGAMEAVGFSHRVGWPLEERSGELPPPYLMAGDLGLLGIGQGRILITPLQAAVMVSIFANKGWRLEPTIIQSVSGQPLAHRPSRHRVGWSAETIEAVRTGMRAVVREPAGTGHRAFSPIVSIAAKTGTAQTHIPGRTHGWFVGFCPVEEPRAAIAIVAEHGGSGGDLPAEIGRTICEYLATPDTL